MRMTRRTLHFSGRVQGVGFRITAVGFASGYEVLGYVKNLPDGRVELVAEGEPSELDGLVKDLRHHFKDQLRNVEVVETPPTGEFRGFDIRY